MALRRRYHGATNARSRCGFGTICISDDLLGVGGDGGCVVALKLGWVSLRQN